MKTLPLQHHCKKIGEGIELFQSSLGNVLFGCPPEVLKSILKAGLPMPDTIVLPYHLRHEKCSQACIEFPFYHFLFVQRGLERGRRFRLIGLKSHIEALLDSLRITVVGPNKDEMIAVGTPENEADYIVQESDYLRLHKADGEVYQVEDMIDLVPIDIGNSIVLYEGGGHQINLIQQSENKFTVSMGRDEYQIDLEITKSQTPPYVIKHQPHQIHQEGLQLTILGNSNGFDPNNPANGFLFDYNDKRVLWDAPAYLSQHLEQLKLTPQDIDAMIISHVHEDHIDICETINNPPYLLYSTPEIIYSLIIKACATFEVDEATAKKMYNFRMINTDKPTDIFGALFHCFHSVHPIPTIGCRVEYTYGNNKALLHVSGDHMSNAALKEMKDKDGISQERFEQITNIITGEETLILIDAGGGLIHGDYRDYLDYKNRIAFVHTASIPEKELPEHQTAVKSGDVFDVFSGQRVSP